MEKKGADVYALFEKTWKRKLVCDFESLSCSRAAPVGDLHESFSSVLLWSFVPIRLARDSSGDVNILKPRPFHSSSKPGLKNTLPKLEGSQMTIKIMLLHHTFCLEPTPQVFRGGSLTQGYPNDGKIFS